MSIQSLSQVSSLYIVLTILLIIYITAMILRYRQSQPVGFSRIENTFLAGLLASYIIIYAYLTLSYRWPTPLSRLNVALFWSYREAFCINNGILKIQRPDLARQIILNIFVMIPIGLLLPLVYHRFHHPFLLTVLSGFILSVLTETVQYFTHLGLCELDDVFHNTLGCLLGVLLFHLGAWVTSRIVRHPKANHSNNQEH